MTLEDDVRFHFAGAAREMLRRREVIAPLAESRLSPAGRLPDASAHVYGGVPPVAARLWL